MRELFNVYLFSKLNRELYEGCIDQSHGVHFVILYAAISGSIGLWSCKSSAKIDLSVLVTRELHGTPDFNVQGLQYKAIGLKSERERTSCGSWSNPSAPAAAVKKVQLDSSNVPLDSKLSYRGAGPRDLRLTFKLGFEALREGVEFSGEALDE